MNHMMPDPVVDLIEAHYPDRIREAAQATRKARLPFLLPESVEARENAIATMARAAKVLATYPQATEVVR
ncbi:hypothetical protein [Streptomyces sp. ISL-94]|uniref:hypothetical protein n=1 Tax=Streptomyces sp. ISL-94 TaxID=2819190 RepID=UPI001BE5C2E6|nr:hypothetical protein [Streptomyces sp. ISL-94]MBT2477582.1 hypothetical protein [Streptomyces sp. ISL-94]